MRRKDAGCTTFARQKFLFFSYTLFFFFVSPFFSVYFCSIFYIRLYRTIAWISSQVHRFLARLRRSKSNLGLLSVFVYIYHILCARMCACTYIIRVLVDHQKARVTRKRKCARVRLSLCEFESTEASCVRVCLYVCVYR